ncbi:enoyl-CoA hydratase/isomerase family protein [Marinobacter sp. CHS3-4]|uniref:enoyl-CoA hydratase/isomerase family protein n=1 Tax=Marinobacter sp. CHS3-4 TaxID=3045174 RepID=UPI0024B50000|nr:enoyl-CoA hydratase/isomerase family protein [Marinobacter sp. CHS3-4]MDI9246354.1 enoyl-CoA hydratase/isomerase family protein [Marinobacter sp. CHS3-4]
MSDESVVFDEIPGHNGWILGVARLNAAPSMNALSLDMIRRLQSQLEQWAQDDQVAAVWLEGEGNKAFCAGGDIVALYRSMTESGQPGESKSEGQQFFEEEYQLDYLIHTFPKPIVVWGNGIVMGGGLGLMVGGSHRVVTEHSKLAMPEVGIGLYPDVGAGWFLNRMPGRVGLFLGLTGVRMNAADALFVGLADRFIPHEQRASVQSALLVKDLRQDAHAGVNQVLRRFERGGQAQQAASPVRAHFDVIQTMTDGDSLVEVVDNLAAYAGDDDWLIKAVKTVAKASPTSLALHWRHYHRSPRLSLAEVFDQELQMSRRSLVLGEFAEGVRALLIDKDLKPRWRFPGLEQVDPQWIDEFFTG